MNFMPCFVRIDRFILAVIVCLYALCVGAQNITETRWYFGNSSHNLVFDRNGRDVYQESTQATPFGNAGAMTITDQFTGNLLFYSDGRQVFDASHTLVPNAILNGNPNINVPVVTVPVTGSAGQYYLFTNSGVGGVNEIQVSIVDATLAGNGLGQFPLGDIVSVNQSTGLTTPSDAMLIIPLGDGRSFWLLSQDRNSFAIRVTEINGGGIGVTMDYNFVDGGTPGFVASHFAFNRDSSLLAMASKTSDRNIWLLGFDTSSGVLTFDRPLTATGFNDGLGESVYDVEWSANGSKLYLSRFGGSSEVANLYQVDLNDPTYSVNPILPAPVSRSLGLKRGIDGKIYHLYQETSLSPLLLGRVNRPDSIPDSVRYQPHVFTGDLDFSAWQFPEFTPSYHFTYERLDFVHIDSCFGNVTKFFPIIEPVPHRLTWDFGDDQGVSDAFLPLYSYAQEGGYMVSLTAEIGGIRQTVTQPVEVFSNDLMVDLGNDTTICVDEVLTLDAGAGQSFVWNTGATTQTISVDTAGTYWVEVTGDMGCTAFDDIEVTEYGIAHQNANQWYFGEQAGIEFTGGATAITDGNRQMAAEGCATISDVNGDLLFYTNGVTIWNRDHDIMINGEQIGGDQEAAQSSLILPFNEDQTMYYVFTTESVYGDGEYALKYTIVDMKRDEGRGAVVIKDIKLMENSTERITASGFSGNDVLLAHEYGNNTFRAYTTGAGGLSAAIFSPSGQIHSFIQELSATGYMKFSPTLMHVAVNIPGTGQVELLDFDVSTRVLSRPRLIDTGEDNLYGLEFSDGGTKLYLTSLGANAKLIQYDLDSLNSANPAADIGATKFDGYPTGANYGALQTGPDGIVYMAIDQSEVLGTITANNGDDAAANFNPSGLDLAGRISRLGLPNFAQNQSPPLQSPSISVSGTCLGQPTTFMGVGRDASIEEYRWIFGDGQSTGFSSVSDTSHTYMTPGKYMVELRLMNRCDEDTTLFADIEIFTLPESPTVPPDTALCDSPIVLEAWPVDRADFSYFWSTGATTRQITVASPSIIEVAIINSVTGCSSDTLQVFIAEARPVIDIGSDLSLCQDDPTVTLDSQLPNATYQWAIDGVVLGNNRTFDITTSTAGSFEYTVAVTNSFGCVGRDTVQLVVSPEPEVSILGNPTTGCGNNDGSMDILFTTSGSYTYQASGPVSFGPANFDGLGSPPRITDLLPGNYILTVTNTVAGCSSVDIVSISDPGTFNFTVVPTGNCENEVNLQWNSLPANYDYAVLDEGGVTVASGANETASTLDVMGLDPGVLTLEVRDNNPPRCVETQSITIPAGSSPAFTFDAIQEICGTQGDIFITDGTSNAVTYTWTPVSGIVGDNTGTTVTVNQPGLYTVVTDDAVGAFCSRSEVIEVIFNVDPVVDVVVTGDPCEGRVTLEAEVLNGSGNYSFNWSDGARSQQNTVTASGVYTVEVLDQLTSCTTSSAPVDVAIAPPFEVTLRIAPDCDNPGDVSLIATPNYFNPDIVYEWRNGRNDVLEDTDSVLTVTNSDVYSVIATNETGSCMASSAFTVTIDPLLDEDIFLPRRATFCSADAIEPTVDLDPGIFNTYEWRLLPDPTVISTEQTLRVFTEGTYEVTLFNGFTCRRVEVVVQEDCRPVIFAPNAFSPNGNAVNEEFFVIPNDYVDEFEIFIYTRWGELIFHSDILDFRWDGTYRKGLAPVGTYVYVLKFSSLLVPEYGTIEQYGSVTLIR